MIVRTLRLERGWSQEQLAQMSGLNIRTIQRIESGQKAGLESLKSLAAVFEVELSQLNPQQEPPMNQTTNSDPTNATENYHLVEEPVYNFKQARAKVLILGARFLLISIMMFAINLTTSPHHIWALWPTVIMGIVFLFRCVDKLVIDALKAQQR